MIGIVTVALQAAAAVEHADRLRPSDGAICALEATSLAEIGIPGRFWNVTPVCKSQGNGSMAENLTCVWADQGMPS
jgi:hypothetical protein